MYPYRLRVLSFKGLRYPHHAPEHERVPTATRARGNTPKVSVKQLEEEEEELRMFLLQQRARLQSQQL